MVGGIPLKRIISLFLALCAAAALLCPSAQAAQPKEGYIAANHTKSNGRPYYIMVNRAQSTVTVYGLDGSGYYTVPVKAMVCSTGRSGHATPTGTYSIGGRWTWVHMFDNSYGQYCTQIRGNILFHSVCYTRKDPSTLITSEYNGLGAPASLGCVRLQTIDAKWIYENCAQGTKVTVYDDAGSPGPLGKPETLVGYISDEQANGWDPTDPRENNPWHKILADSAVQLPEAERVSCTLMAQSLYDLSGGEELRSPSECVAWAAQHGLLDNMAGQDLDPDRPMTRQELIGMLYQYEAVYCGRAPQDADPLTRFIDGDQIHTSAVPAMRWAVGSGLIQGTSSNTLHPAHYASRAQLDIILQRYQGISK